MQADDLDTQLLAQMREDFLLESQEILDRLGPLLVQLEQSGDPQLLNAIFREVHTLKGTAGFVGFNAIQLLAHRLEDMFGALRDGQLAVAPELIDLAFAGLQSLTAMRQDVLRGGIGETDVAPLMARLEAALRGEAAKPSVDQIDESPPTKRDRTSGEPPDQAIEPALAESAPGQADLPPSPSPTTTSSTLRVAIETLDSMIELVGELITARNALLTIAERLQDEPLLNNAAVISRLTHELQAKVTTVRLVPVEQLFRRFTGVVRNMAREHGKQVELLIKGGDTPLDRSISEQMYDPLVHLLRNAVDHGLESPQDRQRVGKPPEGIIRLSAERRGDSVIVRVADDGGGIDPAQVRRVAVERGLYSAEEVAALSDEQATNLIFASGFSTASQVTDVSGRGVGMDVVAQNVRRLRGNVHVETTPGRGTTFVIQLPLTLAILQVQLVRVDRHIYALPLHIVRETLQVDPNSIQTMQQGEVLFIRQVALPLRRLEDCLLQVAGKSNGPSHRAAANGLEPAVVVRLTGRDEVLVVDELVGKQEVVIKPLSPYLGAVRGVEGAAVLPDGSVTLVLDVEGLIA